MKRVLVVTVNWLGDVIFSSPVFRAVHEAYPQAHIVALGVPRVAEALAHTPFVHEVIIYDEDGRHAGPVSKMRLIAQLRQMKFDAAFIVHRSLTRALLVFLAGIPVRVGYDTKGRGMFLTHRIPGGDEKGHRADSYLRVVESFGFLVSDRHSELVVDAGSQAAMATILLSQGIVDTDTVVVINPGGNWDLKRWPSENFAAVIDRLTARFSLKVIISGSAKDTQLAKGIAAQCQVPPLVMTGTMTVGEMFALMKRAQLVVSADSGPLHVANGVGTPVVGIFGPTRVEITGPRGRGTSRILQHDVGCNRQACYHLACTDNICMKSVSAQEVFEACAGVLGKR